MFLCVFGAESNQFPLVTRLESQLMRGLSRKEFLKQTVCPEVWMYSKNILVFLCKTNLIEILRQRKCAKPCQ